MLESATDRIGSGEVRHVVRQERPSGYGFKPRPDHVPAMARVHTLQNIRCRTYAVEHTL